MRYGKPYVYVRKELIQVAQAFNCFCGVKVKVKRLNDVRAQLTIGTWQETVTDPDLKITGGPGNLDPEITGGGPQKKFFFSALRASV